MEPRLKSSIQWSPFPEELCLHASEALSERFVEEYDLGKAVFIVEGRIYSHEVIGLFGLRIKSQLKQHNFEISFEYDSSKDKVLDLIHGAVDLAEYLWTEFLEEDLDDTELSNQWQSLTFEKRNYFFRYSTNNTDLEQEADKLLAEYEKKLVYTSPEHPDLEDLESSPDELLH